MLRFLLLEDNAIDAQLIQQVLSSSNLEHEVVWVKTRAEFIAAFTASAIDLILGDYNLPEFNGIEALAFATQHHPEIPFIIVSGSLGEELAIDILKQGATDYVLKQRLERLVPAVNRALREAQERRDLQQAQQMLIEQKHLLEMIALGRSLDECLAAMCTSVSRLNSARVCFLLIDAQQHTFPHAIALDFPLSFGQGLKDAPINDLCIGTCGEAVYGGEPITCADIAHDDRWSQEWRDLCIAHGILACHSKPVIGINGLPLGSLMLCLNEVRMPTNWEYQLAEFGTQIASIAFERDRSSLAVRESEVKYRTLFESMDQGFCFCEMLFDPNNGEPTDYRFLEINPAFERMTGLENAVGKTAREMVPNLEAAWFDIYDGVVRTGSPVRFEQQSVAMNRWFEVSAFPVGEPQKHQFAIVFTNITDRKQTETALQESETRLRFMLDASQIGEWDLDLTTEPHTAHRSLRHDQIFGYESLLPEWSYEIFLSHVHPDDRAAVDEKFQQTLSANSGWNFECRIIYPDQSLHWIWARSSVYSIDGTPTRLLGMVVDITDRKQAEAALRGSEEQTRNILESIADAFFAVDETWRFTYVNQTAYAMVDRTPGDLIGKLFWEEFPGVNDSESEQMHRRVMRDRVAESVTEFYPDHNRWYEVRSYPAANGITMYFRNVTDQIQAERSLRQTSAELEQQLQKFDAVVSSVPDFIYTFDLSGRFIDATKPLLDLLQKTSDEVVGKNFFELDYSEDLAAKLVTYSRLSCFA